LILAADAQCTTMGTMRRLTYDVLSRVAKAARRRNARA